MASPSRSGTGEFAARQSTLYLSLFEVAANKPGPAPSVGRGVLADDRLGSSVQLERDRSQVQRVTRTTTISLKEVPSIWYA